MFTYVHHHSFIFREQQGKQKGKKMDMNAERGDVTWATTSSEIITFECVG